MTATEKIEKAIENANGNMRDALNIALLKIEILQAQIETYQELAKLEQQRR
jgi:hypothetical protein